jgi:dihydrofolate synthase/folylpolyglutamate synthase
MKIIHVAGTKGKGSTSAMIAAMLSAAGYRAGVFSSPHLECIEERFNVDGKPCTADELVVLVDRLKPVVKALDEQSLKDGEPTGGPTYFELTTAIALLHFVERHVDVAILEVGLGGRLDSTNVCLPVVSVITSISFDHMKQLGNTLSSIAREKAGIIKPGVPVVCGVNDAEPQAVIAEIAREHGCRLLQLGRDFSYTYSAPTIARRRASRTGGLANDAALSSSPRQTMEGNISFSFNVDGQEQQLHDVKLAMRGPHQGANAAVALATIAELRHQGWCVSAEAIRFGMARTVLPGRVELISGEPTIVLDSAHNAASALALVQSLAELPEPSRRTVVLSISLDKDLSAILKTIAPYFDRYIVTQYQENPRAVPAEALARTLIDVAPSATGKIVICPTPARAWQYVHRTAVDRELVCVTGSFFLAAEMRRMMHGK